MKTKEFLTKFYNIHLNETIIDPNLICINNRVFKAFKCDFDNLIHYYKDIFPVGCAELKQIMLFWESGKLNSKEALKCMRDKVPEMLEEFDKSYKYLPYKIFISHSTDDMKIVEKFVTLLEQIGIKQNSLFCSSISAYGIPQGSGDIYNYLKNEFSSNNLFVIFMLSKNYYNSPVCLNEMGASWVLNANYQSILLPDFDFPQIEGVISPRDISFKLDDLENRKFAMNEFKDNISKQFELDKIEYNLWERFRDKFFEEVDLLF